MIALVFPFQTEMEAFLAGLAPAAQGSTGSATPGADSASTPVSIPSLKSLAQRLPLREEPLGGYRSWSLASHPAWRLLVSGQGKVEAALACQTAANLLAPSAYLLLGSATALDPTLKARALVLADPCIEIDFQPGPPLSGTPQAYAGSPHPRFPSRHPFPSLEHPSPGLDPLGLPRFQSGTILSADRDVFDPAEKRSLHETHAAQALAWEGAGFHRFLRRNGSRGWELRLITEEANESRLPLPILKARMAEGFAAIHPLLAKLE